MKEEEKSWWGFYWTSLSDSASFSSKLVVFRLMRFIGSVDNFASFANYIGLIRRETRYWVLRRKKMAMEKQFPFSTCNLIQENKQKMQAVVFVVSKSRCMAVFCA